MTAEHYIIYTLLLMNAVGWAAVILTLRAWHGHIFERVYDDLPPTEEKLSDRDDGVIVPNPGRDRADNTEQSVRSFAGRI